MKLTRLRRPALASIAAVAAALGCNAGANSGTTSSKSAAPASTAAPPATAATPPPSGPLTALKAPTVTATATGTTISWDEAGRGSKGYVVDLDTDADWTDGSWNHSVVTGTTSCPAPAGFMPTQGQGPLMLVPGATYWARVHYTATQEVTPVAKFTAYQAPLAAGAVPPDDIDLAQVTVKTSPQDVADPTKWAPTTKITSLAINANGNEGWQILFTKRDGNGSWPDVPAFGPGPGHDLEYTLWAIVNVGGQWYTSGVIQLWRDPNQQLWIGGKPSDMAMNWWYDANRWAPMTTHQPMVGEQVGFFLTSGNVRNNPPLPDPTQVAIQERTNVVVIPFPADTGVTVTYP